MSRGLHEERRERGRGERETERQTPPMKAWIDHRWLLVVVVWAFAFSRIVGEI
jgi:hypothetical protein